jgi:hypothetical protein
MLAYVCTDDTRRVRIVLLYTQIEEFKCRMAVFARPRRYSWLESIEIIRKVRNMRGEIK